MDFELPAGLEAATPPEERGRGRDDVRLLVTHQAAGRIEHRRFTDLPDLLRAGDLLVVNRSATIPAALSAQVGGEPALLHLASPRGDGTWVVELRHSDPDGRNSPWLDAASGTALVLPEGATARLLRPAAQAVEPGHKVRLWLAQLDLPSSPTAFLNRHGVPIRYGHVDRARPLAAYQTVFATEPGSAEMPSAARPFTFELVTALVARGVGIAPLVLHCGVSSMEAHEPPTTERFLIPAATAERVNATRRLSGRVVAVGTTVVRALETAALAPGLVLPADGWTDLVIGANHRMRVIDGLLTGWHEPRASHLALLQALVGSELLETSYRAA
ncbi:MAG: S-adenosylmethionine:tRNA ribosyltransferase-isomerase, partial [Candidatus Dormibacteraeota bacterium]|nr:S-adenosylmethionine:tRNA ribosyltransferase-isomerase [Candidatus Dormibacteraeota bacterium]